MKTMQKAASVLLLVVAAIALGSMACTQDLKFSKAVPKTPEELLAELKTHQEKIDAATDATMKRIDEFNQTRKAGERTIHFSEIYGQEFTDAQRDVLNQMIAQEKDVSYKSLLEHIVADRNELQGLQEKVMHLEQALPDKFVVVKKGDRHKDLAMNYLVNEMQLPPEKAKTLLAEADQTDELVPGNKVWFAYDPKDDAFRTYVTRGEAKQLPYALRRANQRNLIGERDTARTERDTAQAEVSNLQQVKAGLETDISMLQSNKASLEDSVARLSSDLSFRQNSLFYHAANERSLKDQGVLSTVLKRVKDVKPLQYEASLDLRQGTTINLEPRLFGLESIDRIRLLPPIFQEGRDYTVETSEATGTAKVTILDPELFKGKEVLVSVGG
jgi:predicted  nucleic acid-binding Zn-ribbon protein